MAALLSELVHFSGEETALANRVKQAVEWVFSKPEGCEVLEEAYRLHRKPLTIITDVAENNIGYGDRLGNHVIYANPHVTDVLKFQSAKGEIIQDTLERFFCHEFKHATQPAAILRAQEFVQRKLKIVTGCFPVAPFAGYANRLKAVVQDNAALKNLLGEIYDTHIGPHAAQTTQALLDKIGEDPLIQRFIRDYEVPAIEFEGMMMGKYFGEPCRTSDYLKSGMLDEYFKAMDREGFIKDAFTAFRAQVPEQQAAAGRGMGTGRLKRIPRETND